MICSFLFGLLNTICQIGFRSLTV